MQEILLDEALCKRSGSTLTSAGVSPRQGRPRKIQDTDTIETIRRMKAGGTNPKDIAQLLSVSLATVYRYLNEYDLQVDKLALADGPSCLVCRWLTTQPEDAQAEIVGLIIGGIMRKELFRILKKNGLPVSETTLRNHVHECVLKDRDRTCR